MAAVVFGLALTSALASTADPALQGRLLQRSDGAYFVYKDGAKYGVQPTQLSDDDINAIPDGAPATLDQVLTSAPPAASSAAVPVTTDSATASAPPAPAPQLPATVNEIPFTGSVNMAVPSPFQVKTHQDGLVVLVADPLIWGQEIDVLALPNARDADTVIASARQRYESATHFSPTYGALQTIQPAGKVHQLQALPFKVQFIDELGQPQFVNGSIVALMRSDVPIAVAYSVLSGRGPVDGSPLELVLASLEQ